MTSVDTLTIADIARHYAQAETAEDAAYWRGRFSIDTGVTGLEATTRLQAWKLILHTNQ